MKSQKDISNNNPGGCHAGVGTPGAAEISQIEVVLAGAPSGAILKPTTQSQAGRASHLDQASGAVESQTRFDPQLHFRCTARRNPVLGKHAQAGNGSVPVEKQKRSRELAPVVGLLEGEVVGAEQLAGGVVQALDTGRFEQRILAQRIHGRISTKG